MKVLLRVLFWSGIFVVFFLTQGCVGMVRYNKMDLQSKTSYPRLLNLRNYGSLETDYVEQAEKLVRGHLIKREGEAYGYYVVKYGGKRQNKSLVPTSTAPIMLLLWLCGVPMDKAKFELTAYFYIFDSNGELIRAYEKTGFTKQYAGIYYGYNPTKKVAKKYSELYNCIFEDVMAEAGEINNLLLASGPITDEKSIVAEGKISKSLELSESLSLFIIIKVKELSETEK